LSISDSFAFSDLNHKQRLAIESFKAPQVIIAGPGSGKTSVVCHLVDYLINKKGISPGRILVLTFSQSAAAELKQRIEPILPQSYGELWIGTFHSLCNRFLQENSLSVGHNSGFKVLTGFGEWVVLGEILKRNKEMDISYKPALTKKLLELINLFKQNLIDLQDLKKALEELDEKESFIISLKDKLTSLSNLYTTFQDFLDKGSLLTFPDLISRAIALLKNNKNLLTFYQEKFHYILVDEFQDTDTAQFQLLQLIAGKDSDRKICVVGDPHQSIYRFRGSDVRNIGDYDGKQSRFKQLFPRAKVTRLEHSYRAYEELVEVWKRLNLGGEIIAQRGRKGERIVTIASEPTPLDEAFYIARKIKELVVEDKQVGSNTKRAGYSYKDFAILVRSAKNQAASFEETLTYYHIPYQIVGQSIFHQHSAVTFLSHYLKALEREKDNRSFAQLLRSSEVNLDPALLQQFLQMIQKESSEMQRATIGFIMRLSLDYPERYPLDTIDSQLLPERRPALIERYLKDKKGQLFLKNLHQFIKTFLRLKEDKDKIPIKDFIHLLINNTVLSLRAHTIAYKFEPEEIEKSQHLAQHLHKLVDMITEFYNNYRLVNSYPPTFSHFINKFDELITQYIDELEPEAFSDDNAVSVMTMHQAKGLEFSVVFVAGVIEGILPSYPTEGQYLSPEEMEQLKAMFPHFHNPLPPTEEEALMEEKRLFYVAISRARDKLFLTWPQRRGSLINQPSRFILELNNNNPLSEKSCSNMGLIFEENASLKSSQRIKEPSHILSLPDLEYYLKLKDINDDNEVLGQLRQSIAQLKQRFEREEWISYIPNLAYIRGNRTYTADAPWKEAVQFAPGEPFITPYMINNYLACPRKSFLESILRLGSKHIISKRWQSVVKRIINLLNIPQRKDYYHSLSFEELGAEVLNKLFPEVWEETVPQPSSADELYFYEKKRKECLKILHAYLQDIYREQNIAEIHLPADEFVFHKSGFCFMVPIPGFISMKNGSSGIVEYRFSKKGSKTTEAQWMAKRLLGYTKTSGAWVPPQDVLPILYWWALKYGENLSGEKPAISPDFIKRYYLSGSRVEDDVLPWAVLGYPRSTFSHQDCYILSDEDIIRAEELVLELCHKIREGTFPAEPTEGYSFTCEGHFPCPYASLCRR
jgi:DNA helicase-2/ATP-dependent DNA helicase PcrA